MDLKKVIMGEDDEYLTLMRNIIKTIDTLSKNALKTMKALVGVEKQVQYHSRILEMIQREIQLNLMNDKDELISAEGYTAEELINMESCLVDITSVLKRMNPAAHKKSAVLLKEIRFLLSIGFERENLLKVMMTLITTLNDTNFAIMYEKELKEKKFLTTETVTRFMKEDENNLLPLLKKKINTLNTKYPDTIDVSNNALLFVENAKNLMSSIDALDVDEVVELDLMIRRKILEDECKIKKERLEFEDKSLGEGVFGIVDIANYSFKYPGDRKRTKARVAVKTLKINDEVLKDEYIELSNEIQRWIVLDCPYILKCHGMALRQNHVHLIFDRPGKSLHSYLHDNATLMNRKEVQKVARDIGLGLHQLHSLSILHMNLSTKNILLTSDGIGGLMTISDFGPGFYHYRKQTSGLTVYEPPEVITATPGKNSGWTTKGDIYALGLIIWECSQEAKIPFGDKQYDIIQHITEGKHSLDTKSGALDKWMKAMMIKCIHRQPEKRPSARMVVEKVLEFGARSNKKDIRTDLININRSIDKDIFKAKSSKLLPTAASKGSQAVVEIKKHEVGRAPDGSFLPRPPPPRKGQPRPQPPADDDGDDFEELGDNRANMRKKGRQEEEEDDGYISEESLASRGPNEAEIAKALRRGNLLETIRQEYNSRRRCSKRVKKLKDNVVNADKIELSGLWSSFLWQRKVNDHDCYVLGLALRHCGRIRRLSLEFNKISNEGVDYLATGVGHHKTLMQLFLGGNPKITQVTKLMERLKKNRILEILNLDNCNIDNSGANAIADFFSVNKTLLQLDISGNRVGGEGLTKIAAALTKNQNVQLKSIIIRSQKVSTGSGIKKLKQAAKGRSFNINKEA